MLHNTTYIPKHCNTWRKVVLEKGIHLCGKLLEDKYARKCCPVEASWYGFTSRLLVLPYLEAHTTGEDGLLQLPHVVALLTVMFLLAMVLAVCIQNKFSDEDIHDSKQRMEFVHHNVVKGDIDKRRQHTSQVTSTVWVGLGRQLFHFL